MIQYKTKEEIEIMRQSCLLVGMAHAEAAKILKQPKDQLLLAIQNGHLQILKKKNSPTEVEEEPSVCEDHLLQYFWKKSPYREELTFPK